ncbi:hypothetical protein Scep_001147 [Stephania cephalantha]|uniref:Uncharacterized protein n=1 Tax=Stephania cephalantha TaxID=152367 RepID=A0AAP0Q7F7_9MAGN
MEPNLARRRRRSSKPRKEKVGDSVCEVPELGTSMEATEKRLPNFSEGLAGL